MKHIYTKISIEIIVNQLPYPGSAKKKLLKLLRERFWMVNGFQICGRGIKQVEG